MWEVTEPPSVLTPSVFDAPDLLGVTPDKDARSRRLRVGCYLDSCEKKQQGILFKYVYGVWKELGGAWPVRD